MASYRRRSTFSEMACSRRAASASAATQSRPSTSVSQRSMMRWRRTIDSATRRPATVSLFFILWDIITHASGHVETALVAVRTNARVGSFAAMLLIFAGGIGAGLLGLVYFNRALFGRLKHADHTPSPRSLSLAIAIGLGLHNFSEGLAIGQSARAGAIAFVGVDRKSG